MTETRHLASIGEIDRATWDSLAPASCFYLSHGWLAGQERPDFATAAYTVVSSGSGLLAATPSYDFPAENAPPLPPVAADREVLRVGTRTGYHNEFLLAGTEAEQRSALAELVEGLADHAAGLGRDALLFDFLTTDSLRLLAGLFPVRAQLRSAEAVVHNEGGTFESYRRLLGRNVRKRDYEVRKFERAGLRLETAPLSACVDELAPLIGQTMDRYDASLDLAEIRTFLKAQAEHLDGLSTVFRVVDEEGGLVGGHVAFAWREMLYARVAGFDYTRTKDAYEYFNAVYYGPLRHMERHGLNALHLGLSAVEAKVRRGARLHPVWAAVLTLPLVRGAGLTRDAAADQALADSVRAEAGGGMDDEEWELSRVTPL
ncbi:GNAT family N-acetyltransferase [Streptomyces sp. NRRL S-4]|uniref:GNAT family N-acetyltransferase n=1 Tax=Streptomyces sp. NRRL S-4 TaxID=1519471 RepID=UPI0006B55B0C|nr:GNAT family N-acetyltransferase [Streptomyces sp. NRRL S-4]KPC82979.1 hypothetical protein ADK82_10275 [Streptomyces sp. NRRL S-4]